MKPGVTEIWAAVDGQGWRVRFYETHADAWRMVERQYPAGKVERWVLATSGPRCSITGNPCGTDTWALHDPPDCMCGRRLRHEMEHSRAATKCSKCGATFLLPAVFSGTIRCEDCDQFMTQAADDLRAPDDSGGKPK